MFLVKNLLSISSNQYSPQSHIMQNAAWEPLIKSMNTPLNNDFISFLVIPTETENRSTYTTTRGGRGGVDFNFVKQLSLLIQCTTQTTSLNLITNTKSVLNCKLQTCITDMGAVDGDHSAVQKYSTDTRVFLEYTQTVNINRGCTQLYNRRFDCHAINNRTVPN